MAAPKKLDQKSIPQLIKHHIIDVYPHEIKKKMQLSQHVIIPKWNIELSQYIKIILNTPKDPDCQPKKQKDNAHSAWSVTGFIPGNDAYICFVEQTYVCGALGRIVKTINGDPIIRTNVHLHFDNPTGKFLPHKNKVSFYVDIKPKEYWQIKVTDEWATPLADMVINSPNILELCNQEHIAKWEGDEEEFVKLTRITSSAHASNAVNRLQGIDGLKTESQLHLDGIHSQKDGNGDLDFIAPSKLGVTGNFKSYHRASMTHPQFNEELVILAADFVVLIFVSVCCLFVGCIIGYIIRSSQKERPRDDE